MERIISLNKSNIDSEHICCAISDKKCKESYELKKNWLKQEFDNGYTFHRLEARAKVFIEYGPSEKAWIPVDAPGYLNINCFWVSGKYKGQGYGKELLKTAINDGKKQDKNGLITVTGNMKFHFTSDKKWLLKQGFEIIETTATGFDLLAYKLKPEAINPKFGESVLKAETEVKEGLVAYYSNRCPFSEYHVKESLTETAKKRNIPLKAIKIESLKQAQSAPSPATIFSLFYNGKFITTDVSVCMDSRFDKIMSKHIT